MSPRKSHLPPPGWRIFLSIIFIIGFYIVGSMLALYLFGEKTVAILDGADMAYEDRRGDQDLMYRITIAYHFYANGKEYHNSVVYRSGETLAQKAGVDWPGMVNIRYLKAFPYISNLEQRVSFERELDLVYSFLALALFSWLFCFINGIGGRRKKAEQSLAEPEYTKRPAAVLPWRSLWKKGIRIMTNWFRSTTPKAGIRTTRRGNAAAVIGVTACSARAAAGSEINRPW